MDKTNINVSVGDHSMSFCDPLPLVPAPVKPDAHSKDCSLDVMIYLTFNGVNSQARIKKTWSEEIMASSYVAVNVINATMEELKAGIIKNTLDALKKRDDQEFKESIDSIADSIPAYPAIPESLVIHNPPPVS